LRLEFGSDTELNELEAAGGLVETPAGQGRQEPWREHGHKPGAMVRAQEFQDTREVESHVEETDQGDRENGFITTR